MSIGSVDEPASPFFLLFLSSFFLSVVLHVAVRARCVNNLQARKYLPQVHVHVPAPVPAPAPVPVPVPVPGGTGTGAGTGRSVL